MTRTAYFVGPGCGLLQAEAGSRYRGKLAVDKIAVSGQSCGGLQGLEAAGDPRVATAECGQATDTSGLARPAYPPTATA